MKYFATAVLLLPLLTPVYAQTQTDREAFAKMLEASSAVKHPELKATFTVERTRLVSHTFSASQKAFDELVKSPALPTWLKTLHSYGFTEYVYTNDKDITLSIPVTATHTATVEMLSDDEAKSALTGSGKDRFVRIDDAGFMAAQGASFTLPHIILFMPEALIAARNEYARKQFLSYDPSEEDRSRSLTVFAQGYVGKTYQEGCQSITRVVLLSTPSGGVVEEAYLSESGTEAWANAYGATNQCGWLRAKFSLAAVRKVRAAAQDGEFHIAVFAGDQNTKTYKIKHKHQVRLGLN